MEEKIRKIAVVGTGLLGTQIAIQATCFDYEVSAHDPDEGSFNRVIQILDAMRKFTGKGPVVPMEKWEKGVQRVNLCKDLEEALGDADLVIEAAPEELELKRKLFERLDALAPRGAILATNSSSIPISKIESATTRPERCLNMHFYSPALGLNMVDIMGGDKDHGRDY